MSDNGQNGIFKNYEKKWKIVVSTNIAETSLTIDGLMYIVDCGRYKEKQTDPMTGLQKYVVSFISKASAE